MLRPGRADFEMFAGDSKRIEVRVEGDGVELAGTTIRWRVAPTVRGAALISKSTPAITTEGDDVFVVPLAPADTEGLRGEYYHEAEVEDADGNIATVLTGRVTIKPTLIKPA